VKNSRKNGNYFRQTSNSFCQGLLRIILLAQILKLHLRKSYAQAKQMAEKVQQQSNKAVYNKRAPMNKRNEYGQQKQFF
jgi:hypothetical protein